MFLRWNLFIISRRNNFLLVLSLFTGRIFTSDWFWWFTSRRFQLFSSGAASIYFASFGLGWHNSTIILRCNLLSITKMIQSSVRFLRHLRDGAITLKLHEGISFVIRTLTQHLSIWKLKYAAITIGNLPIILLIYWYLKLRLLSSIVRLN